MTDDTHKVSGGRFIGCCMFALALLTLISQSHASPALTDSVHFSLPLDLEEMRVRDSIYAASKQALNLNVGPPRTVRTIYFLPNDRTFRASVVDSMKRTIRQIQTFYGEQMQAHGYGYKTFDIETDAQGEPIVHRLDGQHPGGHYRNSRTRPAYDEFRREFDSTANVYLIVVDTSGGRGGVARRSGKSGGFGMVYGGVAFSVAAHELGHAFGLEHDFTDNAYIMSYGQGNRRTLSACSAGFLAVHPYFNPDIRVDGDSDGSFSGPIDGKTGGAFELVSPVEYPTGSSTVTIRLNVSDPDGLHQVLLLVRTKQPHPAGGALEVKACRGLEGETRASIEIDYDGVLPSDGGTSLSNPVRHEIFVRAVDIDGDVQQGAFFNVIEISPNHIGTLRHRSRITTVVFSPDGKTLASGSNGGNATLWDVARRTISATLGWGRSVVFSPDGATVAVGGGGIKLWDVSTKRHISTIGNKEDYGWSIAYSSDRTTIASGSDNTINLYDVFKNRLVYMLEGLTGWTNSVVFAPDGRTLASGGTGEGAIRLWDVSARRHIATIFDTDVRIRGISSIAFSPDGLTMASGSASGYVYDLLNLWDVATRQHVAVLSNRGSISTVAFSPDGSMLASGGYDGSIKLWDVYKRNLVTTLAGHTRDVTSVAFSPDGRTLASGSDDSTIRLWDVSEWTAAVAVEPPGSGALKGKKLLVDTVFNRVDDNADKVNEGINTLPPPATGDTIKVELFIEDGGGVSTLGGTVKFAASNMEMRFADFWQIVGVDGVVAVLGAGGLRDDEFTLGGLPAAKVGDNGYFATVNIRAKADIQDGASFYVKHAIIGTPSFEGDSLDVSEAVVKFAIPKGSPFSISLDGNSATGNQGTTTLDVTSGSVVPIQIFGKDILGVHGVSARFEYDAAQVGYEGFDPGSVLPDAQVLAVPGENPTAIDVSVVSFGGQTTVDSGLVGSVRFRTTDAFLGTEIQLVRAEIGRGVAHETIAPADIAVTLMLAEPTPDFNGDGRVDFGDFVAFGMRFGSSRGDAKYEAKYDLDQDGIIGFGDFLIFGQEFGRTVGA